MTARRHRKPVSRLYSPYEERAQAHERIRRMQWTRSDWLATVEDVQFQHESLGVAPIPFSGDTRPVLNSVYTAEMRAADRANGVYRCPRCLQGFWTADGLAAHRAITRMPPRDCRPTDKGGNDT